MHDTRDPFALQRAGLAAGPSFFRAEVGGWPPQAAVSGPSAAPAAGLLVAATGAAVTVPAMLTAMLSDDPETRERAAVVATLGFMTMLGGVAITAATEPEAAPALPPMQPFGFFGIPRG